MFLETTDDSVFESVTSSYQIIQKKVLWHDAQAHCYAIGGHLAAFETQEEYSSISAHIPQGRHHFGLNDLKVERKHVWEHSGQQLGTYRPWFRGEPNNSGNEDCGCIDNGKWLDIQCPSNAYPFICEFAKQ